jgi:hypothetical protein
MVLPYYWGMAKEEKVIRGREKAKEKRAEKDSYGYGEKDFNFALKLDISDNNMEATGANDPPAQATTKRFSGRSGKRKA